MKSNNVSHEGIVVSAGKGMVRVSIMQSSACASCKIAKQCVSSENKEKIIDVAVGDAHSYSIGEKVIVTESITTSALAVICAFVIPLAVMMVSIVLSLSCFQCTEGLDRDWKFDTLLYIIIYTTWIHEKGYDFRDSQNLRQRKGLIEKYN